MLVFFPFLSFPLLLTDVKIFLRFFFFYQLIKGAICPSQIYHHYHFKDEITREYFPLLVNASLLEWSRDFMWWQNVSLDSHILYFCLWMTHCFVAATVFVMYSSERLAWLWLCSPVALDVLDVTSSICIHIQFWTPSGYQCHTLAYSLPLV